MSAGVQATTRKTRILDVVYNASNNELVSATTDYHHHCNSSWQHAESLQVLPVSCDLLTSARVAKPRMPAMQVRTQTLVKNAIIQIDATPFRQWYNQHYGVEVGLKKKVGAANVAADDKQVSFGLHSVATITLTAGLMQYKASCKIEAVIPML